MNVLSLGGMLTGRGAVSFGLLVAVGVVALVAPPAYVTLAIGEAATVDFQPTMPAQVTYDQESAAVVSFTSTPVADVRFEVVPVASVELEVTTAVVVDFELEN